MLGPSACERTTQEVPNGAQIEYLATVSANGL
jgi:hypothetical protein